MRKSQARRQGESDAERDTMRPEYDFSDGVRGATAKRYAQGSNIVAIDPSVMDVFPDAASVNEALRTMARVLRRKPRRATRRRRA
ncbi:MAG: hypothetical protein U0167_09930 [bacterium]